MREWILPESLQKEFRSDSTLTLAWSDPFQISDFYNYGVKKKISVVLNHDVYGVNNLHQQL